MNRRQLPGLLILLGGLAACTTRPTAGDALVGRWQPVSAQLGGQELPIASFQGAVLVLRPGGYAFGNDQGSFSLGAAGPPAQMDIQGTVGPNAGKAIAAIYSVQDDALVICYQLGTGPRPRAFESPPGSQLLLVRYRRA